MPKDAIVIRERENISKKFLIRKIVWFKNYLKISLFFKRFADKLIVYLRYNVRFLLHFFEILHFFEEEVRDDRWNDRWIGDELALKSVCSDNWSNSKVELQQNRSPSFAATLRNNDPKLGFGKSAGEIYSSPSASIVPTWPLVFSVQTLKNKNNWKTIFFFAMHFNFFLYEENIHLSK